MSDLSEALVCYLEVVENFRKAQKECEYDQDYFLHSEKEDLEKAERIFLKELKSNLGSTTQSHQDPIQVDADMARMTEHYNKKSKKR